jgi:hypothetical protein
MSTSKRSENIKKFILRKNRTISKFEGMRFAPRSQAHP